MTERLLHYIWQFQYYNIQQLSTVQDEALQVIHPGQYNVNQGPDFLNAKVRIGNTTWAGSIELHIRSSEWNFHKHGLDENYDNVILHVVWEHDDHETAFPFSTLELSQRISRLLLDRYEELMGNSYFIPCQAHIGSVPELVLLSWKERLLAERLQQRTEQISALLSSNHFHWEEVFWWLLARTFGGKVNADVFEAVARSVPLKIISRNNFQLHKIEALLFGQAGMLTASFVEDYPAMLKKEYLFLKKKYGLKEVLLPVYFLRMRPANFPTIRLAQLAALIAANGRLFSSLKDGIALGSVKDMLDITANDYWHYHYRFDQPKKFKPKTLGKQMVQSLLVNTVVPFLFAYGHLSGIEQAKDKALKWMEELDAEHNHITNGFESLGILNNTAMDSQALLQLKRQYCDPKRCLQCAVGNKILKMYDL